MKAEELALPLIGCITKGTVPVSSKGSRVVLALVVWVRMSWADPEGIGVGELAPSLVGSSTWRSWPMQCWKTGPGGVGIGKVVC